MVLNMGNKKTFLLLISFTLLMSLASVVFASQHETGAGNFLDNIFQPFAGINLSETYNKAPNFIDALFYFLFFIGVVQFALSGYFKGRGGTAVIIAFGATLAIGLAIWTSKIGFRLGDRIGPIAGAIFAILFFVMMVRLFKGEGAWGPAFWIAYLLGFVFINFLFPEVFTIFSQTKYGSIAIAIANLLFFISLVYGLPRFLSQYWGGGGGKEEEPGRGFGGLFGGGRPRTPEEIEEKEERRAREEEKREEEKLLGATKREREELGKIRDADIKNLDEDEKLRRYLERIKSYIEVFLRDRRFLPTDRFLRIRDILLPKLKEVIRAFKDREERDKKISDVIKSNRILLRTIAQWLRKIRGTTDARVIELLKNKFGEPEHISVWEELRKKARTVTEAQKVEDYLNTSILADHIKRQNLLIEIEKILNEAVDMLNIEKKPAKSVFVDIIAKINEAISKIKELIDTDKAILNLEMTLYEKNEFISRVFA